MLQELFEKNRKTEQDQSADEILVPEKLNANTFMQIEHRFSHIKQNLTDRLYLNFSRCRRIDSAGLYALADFARTLHSQQKHVYATDLNNDLFKAIKLSGYQSLFRFQHHGEYHTQGFGESTIRC